MKIIITTDGSTNAEAAIRWFTRLPCRHDDELVVFTVAGQVPEGILSADRFEEISKLEVVAAEKSIDSAMAILNQAGRKASRVLRTGHTADEILRYAQSTAADLIVIGAKGHSMLSRMFLGSVSETVATHAPCSVLVVREPEASEELDARPLRLTLAYDGSKASQSAMRDMIRVDWPNGTEAHLISVIQHPKLLAADIPYDSKLTHSLYQQLDEMKASLKPHFAEVSTKVLEEVHVGESIVNFVAETNTNIVVVGETGKSAIDRFFIGSISRFVLHHASCSVWISR